MTTIRPCPFCGHDDVEIDETGPHEFAVTCPECQTIGPRHDYEPMGAINLWNVRAPALIDFSLEPAT